MKHYLIVLLSLACACFGKVEIDVINLSSHKGDIWKIRTFGAIHTYKVPHAYVKSNALTIKWNIKKGRMSVTCGGLCNVDDEFLIRMFDKDSLRIDFAAYDIKPNQYIVGDEYIIPPDVRKEIAYMEIKPLNKDWKPEYEVMCQDGYTVDPDHNKTVSFNAFPADEMVKHFLPLFTTCMKQKVQEDDYVPDGGWYSDTHDCPPSWQDNDGSCKSGWYSN